MSKKLVLAAVSWDNLREALLANSKHGYNSLHSLEQKDGFFIAGLSQESDVEYMKLLAGEYGMEDYVKLIGEPLMLVSVNGVVESATTKSTVTLRPTPSGIEQSELLTQFLTPEENVALKINRTPRSKK